MDREAEKSNLEGQKYIHLVSEKFKNFVPRSFKRKEIGHTNKSELTFIDRIILVIGVNLLLKFSIYCQCHGLVENFLVSDQGDYYSKV
jgi:hypothetical protein